MMRFRKKIVLTLKPHPFWDTCLIHLSSQPLSSINANLNTEWKPSLNPSVHEAKGGMVEVMVHVQARALA